MHERAISKLRRAFFEVDENENNKIDWKEIEVSCSRVLNSKVWSHHPLDLIHWDGRLIGKD